MTNYVYENTEVVKTGRTATQKLRSGRISIKYEVTPAILQDGTWKKWVFEEDLMVITGSDNGSNLP